MTAQQAITWVLSVITTSFNWLRTVSIIGIPILYLIIGVIVMGVVIRAILYRA